MPSEPIQSVLDSRELPGWELQAPPATLSRPSQLPCYREAARFALVLATLEGEKLPPLLVTIFGGTAPRSSRRTANHRRQLTEGPWAIVA